MKSLNSMPEFSVLHSESVCGGGDAHQAKSVDVLKIGLLFKIFRCLKALFL